MNNAGDSNVVQIGSEVLSYLKTLIQYETKFVSDREGRIIEEKRVVSPFELVQTE